MNAFKRICALILGMVLLVAALLKIMDPVGSSLVMGEYFNFLHLGFLKPLSALFGEAFALLEGIVGIALICGVWRKITALVSGILLLLFTLLTAVLYIAQPAMDCGCFGEALHLSHAQTLLKNLILDALWCLSFIPMHSLGKPQRIKYVSFSLSAVSLLLFMLYSALSIPLRDFTSFKPGTELEEHPLFFTDAGGNYVDSLSVNGPVMLISIYDVSSLNEEEMGRLADFTALCSSRGYTPLVLMAATPEQAAVLVSNPLLLSGIYFADRKDLMTLNRSNGGACYVNDGLVVRKWAARNYPGPSELEEIMQQAPMDCMITNQNRTRALFQGFSLYLFAVLLLL